jgi:hypothetical protein
MFLILIFLIIYHKLFQLNLKRLFIKNYLFLLHYFEMYYTKYLKLIYQVYIIKYL